MTTSAERLLSGIKSQVEAEAAAREAAPNLSDGLRKVAEALRATADEPVSYADLYRVKELAYGTKP